MSRRLNRSVFINCPFDSHYLSCFEAIVFTVYLSGHEPVCALQDDHFGNVRLDKLEAMIGRCDRSINDLSRTETGKKGMPRFNMPFELGLAIGATRYGGVRQRRKKVLVMVRKRYLMAQFLSDAAGQDPQEHGNDPDMVIKLVRNHLRYYFDTKRRRLPLPGARHFVALFREFKRDLPKLAKTALLAPREINSVDGGYLDFLEMLKEFTNIMRRAGKIA